MQLWLLLSDVKGLACQLQLQQVMLKYVGEYCEAGDPSCGTDIGCYVQATPPSSYALLIFFCELRLYSLYEWL